MMPFQIEIGRKLNTVLHIIIIYNKQITSSNTDLDV